MTEKVLVDRSILEAVVSAMLETRTASIAGCDEGYGKPEIWTERLFRSHGGLTKSIKAIEAVLNEP